MDIAGIADYFVGFLVMAGIYAVFSLGLNVHWGYTGLFNIGIAGFFALGAYTAALMTNQPPDPTLFEDFKFGGNWSEIAFLDLGIDLWFFQGLGAAAAVCGVIALVIGYITLRLQDDYLAIATLGIAESVRLFFLNEKWVAKRPPRGCTGYPSSWAIGYRPNTTTTCTWLWCWWSWPSFSCQWSRWSSLPGGGCCVRIREDEVAAEASGKNVFKFKLQAFIFGAIIMGIGGALFAHNIRFLAPLTFDPLLATFVIWPC